MATLVILLLGQGLATMDGSILVVAAPSLQSSLHVSGAELQLVVGMYILAFGALVVTGPASVTTWAAAGRSERGSAHSRWPPWSAGWRPPRRC